MESVLFARFKLGKYGLCGCDLALFKLFIKLLNAVIVLYESKSGFFTDTLYTADIVGAVTHKTFQVNELQRGKIVVLAEFFGSVFFQLLCAVKKNGNIVIDKLQ